MESRKRGRIVIDLTHEPEESYPFAFPVDFERRNSAGPRMRVAFNALRRLRDRHPEWFIEAADRQAMLYNAYDSCDGRPEAILWALHEDPLKGAKTILRIIEEEKALEPQWSPADCEATWSP
jgi:hypothetical protein